MGTDEIPPMPHAGRSWEPADLDELHRLRALVDEAAAVEGDVAGALDRLAAGRPTGQIVTWAWVTDPARRDALLVDHHGPRMGSGATRG